MALDLAIVLELKREKRSLQKQLKTSSKYLMQE